LFIWLYRHTLAEELGKQREEEKRERMERVKQT
jgi:hypothetical protein